MVDDYHRGPTMTLPRPPLTTSRRHPDAALTPPSPRILSACTRRVRSADREGSWRPRTKCSPVADVVASSPKNKVASSAKSKKAAKQSEPSAATSKAAAAAAPAALSRSARFAPWLRHLEGQLLDLGVKVIRDTTGARVESGAEDVDEDDEDKEAGEEAHRQREIGTSAYAAERMEDMQRLGASLGNMLKLVHEELLPRMPTDPEALFLGASADFIARRYDGALQLMQSSLMGTADGHCTPKQLAARHYFVGLIAIRILTESDKGEKENGAGKMKFALPPERINELASIAERGMRESLRLDPRLSSPYIDCEMLAQVRHPEDAHKRVAMHAEMVEAACSTGKYWVSKMQRPMHFYPKLKSKPWWEATDFPWTMSLMAAFSEVRDEVMRMRNPPRGERQTENPWDKVGSKHDAGDKDIVENGAWTELVLLHNDEKVAANVARNRRLCPATLRVLDQIPAASDMARRGIGESTFSALHGGAHLKPHCGSTNCRLTCHLPLIVPKGDVSIRVGNETRQYREGEPMIFDDSYEHEVWQLSDKEEVRVVLLIRFWHPGIPPERWPEAYQHMKKMYAQHRRRIMLPPLQRPSTTDVLPVK